MNTIWSLLHLSAAAGFCGHIRGSKLGIKMLQRKRSEDSERDRDANEALLPLDDEQQQEVIDSLKKAAEDHAVKFRRLFAMIFALISFVFLFFLVRLLAQPDLSLPHESIIGHLLSSSHFLCFYTLSVANFAGCSLICMSSEASQSAARDKERRMSTLQPLLVLSMLIAVVLLIIFIINEVCLRVLVFYLLPLHIYLISK